MQNEFYLNGTSLIILAFILIALLLIGYTIFSKMSKKTTNKKYNKYGNKSSLGVCPICGTILEKNEQVKTALYQGDDNDRLCYIYGCPHCYPISDGEGQRTCPVCKADINDGSHLIARYFVRKDGSEHIHILGCEHCKFSKK